MNDYYAGAHWSKRSEEANRVHSIVQGYMLAAGIRRGDYINPPVTVTVNAYFDNRPLDADNIIAKLYVDGLKGWLLKDDSLKYVAGVATFGFIDKSNPRVEIIVKEFPN